jgi:hypothetical protein
MRLSTAVSLFVCLFVPAACAPGEGRESASTDTADGVVEIVARGLSFDMADSIPAGWTTFRFVNESPYVHFAVVERMPEGHGIVDQQEQVAPVFQAGMDLLSAGKVDSALAAFGDLPPWFAGIEFLGGPGLTSPGHTSTATVHLDPGTYLLECYVKTDGVFHSYNPDPDVYGMVHEFTVTGEDSGAGEPSATVHVNLSFENGMEVTGDLSAGEHTVGVRFIDQQAHENFVGHDVHLARIDDVDIDTLAAWMDWTQPHGLETPAPATFLGGLNEMPAGATGYFSATLEPGRYALVAEVPGSEEKAMLRTFTVE